VSRYGVHEQSRLAIVEPAVAVAKEPAACPLPSRRPWLAYLPFPFTVAAAESGVPFFEDVGATGAACCFLPPEDSKLRMIRIQVRPNEPLETALRRFKRQCNYAGVFRLAKKAAVYEKPSEKRRREERERVRNMQRALRKALASTRRTKKKGLRKPGAGRGPGRFEEDEGVDATAAVPVVTGAGV
jgi:small subunit ribosomal protein S21